MELLRDLTQRLETLKAQYDSSPPDAPCVNKKPTIAKSFRPAKVKNHFKSQAAKTKASVKKLRLGQDLGSALDKCVTSEKFPLSHMNDLILFQLWAQGHFDVAARFIQESGCSPAFASRDTESKFRALDAVRQACRQCDAEACLEWLSSIGQSMHDDDSSSRSAPFDDIVDDIRFSLYFLKFFALMDSLRQEPAARLEAFSLLRTCGANFFDTAASFDKRFSDLRTLMRLLLTSSVGVCDAQLIIDRWLQVESDIHRVFFRHNGFPEHNPLVSCLLASERTLLHMLKYVQIARNEDITDENIRDMDMNLGVQFQYHSTFVCPVTKEETSSENPIVVFSCGHAMSQSAMNMLIEHRNRVKCPTCPMECSRANAKIANIC